VEKSALSTASFKCNWVLNKMDVKSSSAGVEPFKAFYSSYTVAFGPPAYSWAIWSYFDATQMRYD
jgi:hypothetical protein